MKPLKLNRGQHVLRTKKIKAHYTQLWDFEICLETLPLELPSRHHCLTYLQLKHKTNPVLIPPTGTSPLQSSLSSRISPTDMHLQETCMYPTGLPPQVGTCSKTPPNTTCCPSTIAQLHSCSRHIVFGSAFCTIAVWKPRKKVAVLRMLSLSIMRNHQHCRKWQSRSSSQKAKWKLEEKKNVVRSLWVPCCPKRATQAHVSLPALRTSFVHVALSKFYFLSQAVKWPIVTVFGCNMA